MKKELVELPGRNDHANGYDELEGSSEAYQRGPSLKRQSVERLTSSYSRAPRSPNEVVEEEPESDREILRRWNRELSIF